RGGPSGRTLKAPAPRAMAMRPPAALQRVLLLAERERKFLLGELTQVKGLMPMLMRRRNKQKWTREELAAIRAQLRRLTSLSPYLVVIVMPGGFAVLPVLAWWLDRRRARRAVAVTIKSG
ncbi:MAG TPA: hypothetical protein VMI15_01555, partial [Burkholderiales bacterium]|nr:hypothetical protein [Burkholderiales bacterium]